MAFCPPPDYQVGQVLNLSVIPEHDEARSISTIHVQIRQLQKPHTLSCCMVADILGQACQACPDPVFLKLYDRRLSEQLRRDYGIDPWTKDAEMEYVNAVRIGAAREFLHNLHTIPNYEQDTEETWDDGQNEVFLADKAQQIFDAETAVYNALGEVQGKLVPRLIARLQLAHSDATELLPPIKGILLQYINGFPLSKVQDHAPESKWQSIVDQAVAVVQVVGDHGILNRDVRPDNFIVRRETNGGYGVFMIDFGLARLRGRNESDRDWARAKLTKDEEGAVGLVMKKRLARHGFELRYQESERYYEWAGGDDE